MFHFSHLLKHLLLHQKMHQLFQGLANGINQVRDLHFFAINTSKFIRNYEHVYLSACVYSILRKSVATSTVGSNREKSYLRFKYEFFRLTQVYILVNTRFCEVMDHL